VERQLLRQYCAACSLIERLQGCAVSAYLLSISDGKGNDLEDFYTSITDNGLSDFQSSKLSGPFKENLSQLH
jgi:hypothetical protein